MPVAYTEGWCFVLAVCFLFGEKHHRARFSSWASEGFSSSVESLGQGMSSGTASSAGFQDVLIGAPKLILYFSELCLGDVAAAIVSRDWA